jgi:hypothetical protein
VSGHLFVNLSEATQLCRTQGLQLLCNILPLAQKRGDAVSGCSVLHRAPREETTKFFFGFFSKKKKKNDDPFPPATGGVDLQQEG